MSNVRHGRKGVQGWAMYCNRRWYPIIISAKGAFGKGQRRRPERTNERSHKSSSRMPRGVPKSGSVSSTLALAAPTAPPPTRAVSSRSAKMRANASIMEHDTDIDALIRKHDKKGARGFAKTRKTAAVSTTKRDVADDKDEEDDKMVMTTTTTKDQENVKSAPKTRSKAKATRKPKATAAASTASSSSTKEAQNVTSSPSLSPKKMILGESRGNHNKAVKTQPASIEQDDKQEGPSSSSSFLLPSSSPRKAVPNAFASPGKRRNNNLSPKKRKGMPEFQISSFLENYDLEAENRLRIAQKTLQISIDSARTQMHAKAIARLPRSVRLMRLGDFVHLYGADVQAAVEQAAVVANRAREGAWEEEKLQRKRKGEEAEKDVEHGAEGGEMESGAKGKLARLEKSNADKKESQVKRPTKGKKASRKAKGASVPARAAIPSSPPRASSPPIRTSSIVRPPTAATFTPNLKRGTAIAGRSSGIPTLPPTPAGSKGRAARAGEQVQWLSLNGSPIIGIIGPDGTVHSMPRTLRRSPSSGLRKRSKNWQAIDEESDAEEDEQDAETSAQHLLDLAKRIDGNRNGSSSGSRSRGGLPSVEASPFSRQSLHTAQASQRETLDGDESDEGGSVFEEAQSRPGDADERSVERDLGYDSSSSLPDEEAYMAQVMREEEQKRARMLASEPRMARSSASSRAYGARSSGSSAVGAGGGGGGRASHSTIRGLSAPQQHRSTGAHPSSSSYSNGGEGRAKVLPSSPMVRNKSSGMRLASSSSTSSSSPNKGRVSIVFGTGSQHRMTNFSVEDLMRLPSHERNQMLDILEKLKRAQASSTSSSE